MGASRRAVAPPSTESARALRVLLDGRKILDGGIGVYLRNLAAGLVQSGVTLSMLGDPAAIGRFRWASSVRVLSEHARGYSLRELLVMARRVPWAEFDLFHEPHYTLPFGIPVPRVITIHDLIHLTHPERVFYPIVASVLMRRALARADAVIAVSVATAGEIAHRFHRTVEAVIPNAVSPELLENAETEASLRARIGTASPYLFALVSQSKPHKGVADLLTAWRTLGDTQGVSLVLAGQGAETRSSDTSGVIRLGRVDASLLRALYANARAVVVPSVAEGFSLPVLEAHAFGAPVVVRPVPAALELRLPTDIVCEDFSIGALSVALRRALSEERGSAASQCSAVRSQYSVARVAEQTMAVYRSVLRAPP